MLDLVYDEVRMEMNPDNDDCPTCGGEGVIFECFDGFCIDAEIGCDECTSRCPECARRNLAFARAVRKAVIESDDVDLARAWFRSINRPHGNITDAEIKAQMATARAKLEQEESDAERDRAEGEGAAGAAGAQLRGQPADPGSAAGEGSQHPQDQGPQGEKG